MASAEIGSGPEHLPLPMLACAFRESLKCVAQGVLCGLSRARLWS